MGDGNLVGTVAGEARQSARHVAMDLWMPFEQRNQQRDATRLRNHNLIW